MTEILEIAYTGAMTDDTGKSVKRCAPKNVGFVIKMMVPV